MKLIGQYFIKSCEKVENGTKLTLVDYEGKEITGVYNLGNLTYEQIEKMIGQKISCSNKDENLHVHKAWNGKTPTFCDDPKHGFDR